MTDEAQDIWSSWLLHRRDADDAEAKRLSMEYLRPIRDRVLENAAINDGDTVLDVGCGDGLIAFGALERTKTGTVIFSDISQDLLTHCREIAEDLGLTYRCQFLRASAEDLAQVSDGSVSAVTTRSVLIYVLEKTTAFREFHRVLTRGGRLSLFEPINSFGYPLPDHIFAGFDVAPVVHLARKVKAIYRDGHPSENDPMIDFDERDLLHFAQEAGFEELHLSLEADIEPPRAQITWEAFLHRAPNPLAPTLGEAVSQALTPTEGERFLAHLRPLVEKRRGTRRMAVAYLWGVKTGDG